MFRVPAGTEMTPRLLGELIAKHKREVTERYEKLRDAYKNDFEILRAPKKDTWKPDNRITVNFAKYIVDTMNGFTMGNPIKIMVDGNEQQIEDYVEFMDKYNDQDDNNAELSKTCCIYGKGYEMYFVDDAENIGITYLTPLEAFMVYDDSILEQPLFFVRYYSDYENVERGSWSDNRIVRHFENRAGIRWDGEEKLHGFPDVPATEYIENEERMGIFESVLSMMNAFNKAFSEKANDVDYFADAYLKILGPGMEKDETKHIRENRIINFEGSGEALPVVDFLQKPDGDATQENLLDRLERLIFLVSMVANISDKDFGSSSGISLRYKLQPMSNLEKTKERKFTSGMNRRYKLIFGNPLSPVKADDWVKLSYKFTPNFPANLLEEAEIASKIEGIASHETQLKVLSVVENVPAELDRINQESGIMEESIVDRRMFERTEGLTDEQ